jgi:hypothetical protein
MKPNRRLIEAWQKGVPLCDAWWAFAEPPKNQLFLEMESEGLHLELERSLKQDLTDRLYAGQPCAIGVESESGGGPVYIPEYYFLKTAKIDWVKGTLAALDKEFYHVAPLCCHGPTQTNQRRVVASRNMKLRMSAGLAGLGGSAGLGGWFG